MFKKIWTVIFQGEKNTVVSYTFPGQDWTSPKICSIIFAPILFCLIKLSTFTVVLSSILFYMWFWISEVDFLHHWGWYGAQVDAVTAESHFIWSFHPVTSGVFILLDNGPWVPFVVGSV